MLGAKVGVLLTALAMVGVVLKGLAGSVAGLGAIAVAGLLYLGGGAAAGAIIGLLLPLTERRVGLYCVASLAAFPFYAALFYFLGGFNWSMGATVLLLIVAPVSGVSTTFAWTVLGGQGHAERGGRRRKRNQAAGRRRGTE